MNLKQTVISANDLPLEQVEVPEWGCTIYIKSLSGGERLKLEQDVSKDERNALFRVVCATLADDQGNLLFSYPDELELLKSKSVKVLQRLFKLALKANAMRPQDVEDLAKN